MVKGLIYLWVRYRMRKLITVHLQAMPIQIPLRIVHGIHLKKNDWQSSMRRNYRTKLGLGYDEAKFNYLNNSQFSCFYKNCWRTRFLIYMHIPRCSLYLHSALGLFPKFLCLLHSIPYGMGLLFGRCHFFPKHMRATIFYFLCAALQASLVGHSAAVVSFAYFHQ